ncbi:MAG: hypothetical protein NZ703_05415, partial [Gemmataceae bacterium]|nr:hypothetical protein [Gemmataceae bacterium]
MIRTRVLIGTALAVAAAAMLYADTFLAPWFPLLGITILVVQWRAAYELWHLLDAAHRPPLLMLYLGLTACWAANWWPVAAYSWLSAPAPGQPLLFWPALGLVYCVCFIVAFLWEMAWYPHGGIALPRLAVWAFILTYLGLLGSFFLQLRFLPVESGGAAGLVWLAAA